MARCLKYPVAFLILMTCALNPYASGASEDGTASFRSELWQMEYHTESEHQKQTGNEPQGEPAPDPETQAGKDSATTESTGEPTGDSAYRDHPEEPELVTPGEIQPAELDQETPFADWQVDAEAAGEAHPFTGEPTAWELSRASGFRQGLSANAAKGPSAITFAVAIVACIIVVGAMFSGRE
ncbi:MAG: hypothetical protein RIK87_29360 [Fuerstiella sp.]